MNNIEKFEGFLDRMQGLLDNAKKQGHIIVRVEDLENTFPELKESEDERIKNRFIKLIKMSSEVGGFALHKWEADEMLAWLEKQGEQKPAEWSEEDNEHVKSIIERLEGMCKKGATFTTTRFAVNQDIDWLKSLKQRIGG